MMMITKELLDIGWRLATSIIINLTKIRLTLQLDGCRYFPVTYWSKECLASGAKEGWVMAANVTSPQTETDTTNMPPETINNQPLHYFKYITK